MARSGMDVPAAYASVMITASKPTLLVAATVIIEARIGPTHGVQTSPKLTPTNIPEKNPSFVFCLGVSKASRENSFSIAI